MRKTSSLLLYFFLGLIIVGLATQLIKNPGQFITSILILLGVAFIVFIIMRSVLDNRQGLNDPESKKYKEAVKQSQKKYGKPVSPKNIKKKKTETNKSSQRKKRRRKSHIKDIKVQKKDSFNELVRIFLFRTIFTCFMYFFQVFSSCRIFFKVFN